jgi:hypothetical protein
MSANHESGDPAEQRDDGVGEEDDVEPEEQEDVDVDEEESNEDHEEDSNSDEEDDDDDDDDDDESIVEGILFAMNESARSDGSLLIESDLMDGIARLNDQGMDILVERLEETSASEASWDHLITRIAVDVEHPNHDMNVARRITRILDCLTLASLAEFGLEEEWYDEDDALHQWKPLVVDHFVKWMTTTTSITRPERLSSFRLGSLGYDPTVWDNFTARYASMIKIWLSLGEGTALYPNSASHATAFALSMRRLPQLRELRIAVHVAGASSSLLSCLCQGLLSLRQVDEFAVLVFMKETTLCSSCTKDSELVLREIGNVLAFASSLTNVTFGFNEAARERMHDVGVIFDQIRSSGSISKLTLCRVKLCGPKQTHFHKAFSPERRTNWRQRAPGQLGCVPSHRSRTSPSRAWFLTSVVLGKLTRRHLSTLRVSKIYL